MIVFPDYMTPILHQALGLNKEQVRDYTHFTFHRHELERFMNLLELHHKPPPKPKKVRNANKKRTTRVSDTKSD